MLMADICSKFCEGDVRCTNGSYIENGVCHNYYVVPNTDMLEFCYRSSESDMICQSTFAPLSVKVVQELLQKVAETSSKPTKYRIPFLVPSKEFKPRSKLGRALVDDFLRLKRFRYKVEEALTETGFTDALDHWRNLGGPQLICFLYKFIKPDINFLKSQKTLCASGVWGYLHSSHTFEEAVAEVVWAIMTIATHVGRTWQVDPLPFADEIGLTRVCSLNPLIFQTSEKPEWNEYCPGINYI